MEDEECEDDSYVERKKSKPAALNDTLKLPYDIYDEELDEPKKRVSKLPKPRLGEVGRFARKRRERRANDTLPVWMRRTVSYTDFKRNDRCSTAEAGMDMKRFWKEFNSRYT